MLALAVFFRLLFLIGCSLDSRNGYLINFETRQTLINLFSSSARAQERFFLFQFIGENKLFQITRLSGLISISSPNSISMIPSSLF